MEKEEENHHNEGCVWFFIYLFMSKTVVRVSTKDGNEYFLVNEEPKVAVKHVKALAKAASEDVKAFFEKRGLVVSCSYKSAESEEKGKHVFPDYLALDLQTRKLQYFGRCKTACA